MTLPTLIAELEEALKAATPDPWRVSNKDPVRVVTETGTYVANTDPLHNGRPRQENDARLIALMRNSLPTLIEAVKRQGEALEMIANSPTCGVGCNPALLFETARAALKEPTDD